jgi:hypothetical protein
LKLQLNISDFLGRKVRLTPDLFLSSKNVELNNPDFLGRKKVQLNNPDFLGSKKQAFASRHKVGHDENDFGDLDYLIKTLLSTKKEKFPLQRALALYCLFVFSIWAPREEGQKTKSSEKAREAARLVCGLFNLAEQSPRQKIQLREAVPETAVESLNQKYFQQP